MKRLRHTHICDHSQRSQRQWGCCDVNSVLSCPGCANELRSDLGLFQSHLLRKGVDSQYPWILRKIYIMEIRSFSLQSSGILPPVIV